MPATRTILRLLPLLALFAPLPASAQSVSLPSGAGLPAFGPPGISSSSPRPVDEALSVSDTFVGILDGALPRSTLRTRFDVGDNNHHPTRAEFFQSKPGVL